MGLSMIVGSASALVIGVAWAVRKDAHPAVLAPMCYASLAGAVVAVAALPSLNHTALFAKDSARGSFPWWSRALFLPYMVSLRCHIALRRKTTSEPLFSEVAEGLYVGGWPFLPGDLPPGDPAIVDCTCELPRSAFAEPLPYFCIPTWDSRGPHPKDIEAAVQWAVERRKENRPVYVHCAFGHGRSVAVMCALLVSLGLATSWRDAERKLKERRPCIQMNTLQKASLDKWSRDKSVNQS